MNIEAQLTANEARKVEQVISDMLLTIQTQRQHLPSEGLQTVEASAGAYQITVMPIGQAQDDPDANRAEVDDSPDAAVNKSPAKAAKGKKIKEQ